MRAGWGWLGAAGQNFQSTGPEARRASGKRSSEIERMQYLIISEENETALRFNVNYCGQVSRWGQNSNVNDVGPNTCLRTATCCGQWLWQPKEQHSEERFGDLRSPPRNGDPFRTQAAVFCSSKKHPPAWPVAGAARLKLSWSWELRKPLAQMQIPSVFLWES